MLGYDAAYPTRYKRTGVTASTDGVLTATEVVATTVTAGTLLGTFTGQDHTAGTGLSGSVYNGAAARTWSLDYAYPNDWSTSQTVYGLMVDGPSGGLVLKVNTEEIRIDDSHTAAVYTESTESADTTLTLANNGTHKYNLFGTTYTVQARLNIEIDGKLGVSGGKAYNRAIIAAGDGAVANGTGAAAIGNSAQSTGGVAFGSQAVAASEGSAIGPNTSATGSGSAAFGESASASGNQSAAFAYGVTSGLGAFAGPSTLNNSNEAIGPYSSAIGPKNIARGYASHVHSDNSTANALTAGIFGGGHNYIENKGANIAGPYSGADGADSFIGGGAFNYLQALRGSMLSAFDGDNYSDYSLLIGNKPKASDAHDGAFIMKGNQGDDTTDTTGPNQALFYPDAPASGGQLAIKGQPSSGKTLTVWGDTTIAGAVDTTGTISAATLKGTGLTSGRVPFATTGGALTDAAALAFNSGTGALSATSFSGSGASLTALNGSNVASGTVADARLSSNVPLKDAANTFSATMTGSEFRSGGVSPFIGTGSYTNLNQNAYYSGGWKRVGANFAHQLEVGGNGVLFRYAASSTADSAITWSNILTVRDDGQIRTFGASPDSSNDDFAENHIYDVSGAKLTAGGTWTNASDRELKFMDGLLTPTLALRIVKNTPISQWEYKATAERVQMKDGRKLTRAAARSEWKAATADDDATTRGQERFGKWLDENSSGTVTVRVNQRSGEKHVGPAAQEFRQAGRALGLDVGDDHTLAPSDMVSVLWVAVQQQQAQIDALEARITALEKNKPRQTP